MASLNRHLRLQTYLRLLRRSRHNMASSLILIFKKCAVLELMGLTVRALVELVEVLVARRPCGGIWLHFNF